MCRYFTKSADPMAASRSLSCPLAPGSQVTLLPTQPCLLHKHVEFPGNKVNNNELDLTLKKIIFPPVPTCGTLLKAAHVFAPVRLSLHGGQPLLKVTPLPLEGLLKKTVQFSHPFGLFCEAHSP